MRDRDNALFYVAVKVFLRDKSKLLILKDEYGDWDLPGGRIRNSEFNKPLEQVVEREVREELGPDLKYSLSVSSTVFMRHSRHEQTIEGKPLIRIFAIGYEAKFLGGDIYLSHEHTEMLWLDIKTFAPDKYFRGGWLKGVQEYIAKAK